MVNLSSTQSLGDLKAGTFISSVSNSQMMYNTSATGDHLEIKKYGEERRFKEEATTARLLLNQVYCVIIDIECIPKA